MDSQLNQEVRYSTLLSHVASNFIFPLEFRVASSGMAWRGEDAENVVAMSSTDIKWVRWLRVARGFQLRVGLKDRRREVFEGFERDVSYLLLQLMNSHSNERWHPGP
jgi:POB3-like N-terminal PH domain